MHKAKNGDVIVYSGLTEDQWTAAIVEAKARAMGHGYGVNEERGHYFELFPEGRSAKNLAAIESLLA